LTLEGIEQLALILTRSVVGATNKFTGFVASVQKANYICLSPHLTIA